MVRCTSKLVMGLAILGCSTAWAQQDPNDRGQPDSVFVEMSRPDPNNGSLIAVDLYVFNDQQNLSDIVYLLSWNLSTLHYDSLRWSPLAEFAFYPAPVFDPPDRDSVNAWQQLPFVGLHREGRSLTAGPDPKLMVTWYLHLHSEEFIDWVCVDSAAGVEVYFVDLDANYYKPIWRGEECRALNARDLGQPDSIYVELSQELSGPDHFVMADVYFLNDAQALQAGALVFSWDHPGLYYDSCKASPLADSAFGVVANLNIDSAQHYHAQAFGLLSFSAPGLAPHPAPRWMGTLYYHVTTSNPGESVCFDTVSILGASTMFVTLPGSMLYEPVWRDKTCLELLNNPTDVDEPLSSPLPEGFHLAQNYPNPFNPATSIRYSLAVSSQVELTVINVLGQTVTALVDGVRSAGVHSASWEGKDAQGRSVTSGVYFYRLRVGDFVETKKMLLLK